jgi:hypothetical protein
MHLDPDQRAQLKAAAQARIDAATRQLDDGTIRQNKWQDRVSEALADAYLRSDDPRWQSGFDGDATLWREAREFLLDAVVVDGTFLDVGCATAHLMESLERWATERRRQLRTYGVELNAGLAAAARRRLPSFADRIFTGNVSHWQPPRRFTYVRTGLEYVPRGGEAGLARRLLTEFVEPGGRLIVGPINADQIDGARQAIVGAGVHEHPIASPPDRNGKVRYILWSSPNELREPG